MSPLSHLAQTKRTSALLKVLITAVLIALMSAQLKPVGESASPVSFGELTWGVAEAYADLYTTVEEDGVVTITTEPSRRAKVLSRAQKSNRSRGKKSSKQARSGTKKARRAKKRGAQLSDQRAAPQGAFLPKRALPFKPFVEAAALYYQLPTALIWGVMEVESNFNPKAVSDKGAQGLMQLMPFTSTDMGVSDPFNPEQNIWGATRLLRILANRFNGDVILTLSAYHAGGGAVSDAGGIPYERTAQYVRSTFNAYKKYAGEQL